MRTRNVDPIFGSRAFVRLTLPASVFRAYPQPPEGFVAASATQIGRKLPDGTYEAFYLEEAFNRIVVPEVASPLHLYTATATDVEIPFDQVVVDDGRRVDFPSYNRLSVRRIASAYITDRGSFRATATKDIESFYEYCVWCDENREYVDVRSPEGQALIDYARACDAWRFQFDHHSDSNFLCLRPLVAYEDLDPFWPEFEEKLREVIWVLKSHDVEHNPDGTISIFMRVKTYPERLRKTAAALRRLLKLLRAHHVKHKLTVL